MSIEVWGIMNKSSEDPEKIEDAIDRIVEEHNDDPTAHLEVGQSLTSHRASEIIDHRAESVVNDKLKQNSRKYIAIVDVDSPSDYDNLPDALTYAEEQGGGVVFVRKGYYEMLGSIFLGRGVDIEGEGIDETIFDFKGLTYDINSYEKFVFNSLYYNADLTNGSTSIIFPTGTTLITDGVVPGMYCKINSDLDGHYKIVSVDSETEVTIESGFTGTTGTHDCEPTLYADYINGSRIVTFPTELNLAEFGVFAGVDLLASPVLGGRSIVTSIDEDNVLSLSSSVTGGSGSYETFFNERVSPPNVIKDFTVMNCGSDFAFKGDGENGVGFDMENIRGEYCIGLVYRPDCDILNILNNVQAYRCTGTYLYQIGYCSLENVGADVVDADVQVYRLSGTYVLDKCEVDLNNVSNGAVFNLRSSNGSINNCRFLSFQILDASGASRSFIRFSGNYLSASNGYNIEWAHDYSPCNANIFNTYSGYNFRLTSSSRKSIVTGNWLRYSITDLGVGNVSSPNVIGT